MIHLAVHGFSWGLSYWLAVVAVGIWLDIANLRHAWRQVRSVRRSDPDRRPLGASTLGHLMLHAVITAGLVISSIPAVLVQDAALEAPQRLDFTNAVSAVAVIGVVLGLASVPTAAAVAAWAWRWNTMRVDRAQRAATISREEPMADETPAHQQRTTIHLLESIPAHEPRESDPHYHLFNAAKARMRKLGLLKCAIAGCTYPGPIELHHSKIEFSLQEGVDLAKFNEFYGLHLEGDEAFQEYIEQEGNLEALCPTHHRTHLGVHVLPEPFWNAIRVWKAGAAPPAAVE